MNIKGKYGIPNLSNLSKISHENEILSQRDIITNKIYKRGFTLELLLVNYT